MTYAYAYATTTIEQFTCRISVKVPRNPTWCFEGPRLRNPNNFFKLVWWLNQPIWNIPSTVMIGSFPTNRSKKNKKSWKTLNLFWRLESKTKREQYYNLWANMSILGDFSRCSPRAENSSSWCLWWACVSNKLVQLAYLGKHKHIWNIISNKTKETTIK